MIPNAWVIRAFQSRGYHIVSTAYRFSPHCGMDEQVADCLDAYKWCLSHLPTIFGAANIDLSRFVAAGDSAGGTFSTLCGHFLEPPPRAVIDVFGVVDMTDSWFHTSRAEHLKVTPFPYLRPRDEAELEKAMRERDPAQAMTICPWDWELEMSLSDTIFLGDTRFHPRRHALLPHGPQAIYGSSSRGIRHVVPQGDV